MWPPLDGGSEFELQYFAKTNSVKVREKLRVHLLIFKMHVDH